MLGAFFVVLGLGLGIMFRFAWGDGELGSTKSDQLGAYETFSAAAPFVLRVVTATVDPPVDPARPWERFKSISVEVTLPNSLSIAAKRLDGDHLVDLRGLGYGRFRDDFPSDCYTVSCARTYVLAACWLEPSAGGSMSVFMGSSIVAAPAGTSPASVTIAPEQRPLPSELASNLARTTGCAGSG